MATTFGVLHSGAKGVMVTAFRMGKDGKRHTIKLTPMQPLSLIVEHISKLTNQKLDPSACTLIYNKKEIDVSSPVRFANLPSGATLELRTGQERALGIQERPPPPQQQPPAQQPAAAAAVADCNPTQPAQAPRDPSSSAPPSTSHPQQAEHSAAAPSSIHTVPAAPQAADAPLGISAEVRQEAPSQKPEQEPLPFGRTIHIFTRAAAAEQEAAIGADEEEPPEFFEFTADDYVRVVASHAQARQRTEAATLMTQRMREQEARRRAASLGPVPVRIHFPDALILQASFGAVEQISAMRDLLQKCLLPGITSNWYLYTTPPKQVIKDYAKTFYEAGLVPAANVHFAVKDGVADGGPFLRPEVLVLVGPPPAARGLPQKERPSTERAQVARAAQSAGQGSTQSAGARRDENGSRDRSDGQKLPKWMKLPGK